MIEGLTVWQAVIAALTVGGAWGGVKVAMNGTKERVHDVQRDLSIHMREDHEIQHELLERTVRIETKLDALLHEKNRDI